MIDTLFLMALLCGCIAAMRGNRTAWALLGSAIFTSVITLAGVPFNSFLWMLIDLAVVMLIMHARMSVCDTIILMLFIPAWCLYVVDGWFVYYAVSLIVTLQFLLTWPIPAVWGHCRRMIRPHNSDPFDRIVSHA